MMGLGLEKCVPIALAEYQRVAAAGCAMKQHYFDVVLELWKDVTSAYGAVVVEAAAAAVDADAIR